jgi:hypothetical protein
MKPDPCGYESPGEMVDVDLATVVGVSLHAGTWHVHTTGGPIAVSEAAAKTIHREWRKHMKGERR